MKLLGDKYESKDIGGSEKKKKDDVGANKVIGFMVIYGIWNAYVTVVE